jgi:hypothetical protein
VGGPFLTAAELLPRRQGQDDAWPVAQARIEARVSIRCRRRIERNPRRMRPRAVIAIAVTGLATLAGCSAPEASGTAHAPVSVPSPARDVGTFSSHTCIVSDSPEAETVAVSPTSTRYDAEAQNVCGQLFGAPKTHATGIPAGYVLRCTGHGYGLVTRLYTRSGAKGDCRELAEAGYRVSDS